MRGALRHVLVLRAFSAAFSPVPRHAAAVRSVARHLSSDSDEELRALIRGTAAASAANLHTPWSADDDALLWSRQDADLDELARELGRKPAGVRARIAKLRDESSAASERLFGADAEPADAKVAADDHLALDDASLLRQCKVDTYRSSGPGGQHANKVESAVRLTHGPTGLVASASDERSQHRNRAIALKRLRWRIAHAVRRPEAWLGGRVDREHPARLDELPPALVGLLPWAPRSKASPPVVGKKNPERPRGEQYLLDVLDAASGSVGDAAAYLRTSTSQLSKLLCADTDLLAAANAVRGEHGLKPLQPRR